MSFFFPLRHRHQPAFCLPHNFSHGNPGKVPALPIAKLDAQGSTVSSAPAASQTPRHSLLGRLANLSVEVESPADVGRVFFVDAAFAKAVALRVREGGLPRPFKVGPCSTAGASVKCVTQRSGKTAKEKKKKRKSKQQRLGRFKPTNLTIAVAVVVVILPSLARTVRVQAVLGRAVLLPVLPVEPGGRVLVLAGVVLPPLDVGRLVGLEELPVLRADRPQGRVLWIPAEDVRSRLSGGTPSGGQGDVHGAAVDRDEAPGEEEDGGER